MFKVEYTELALKDLKKLDKYTRKLILTLIEKNLVNFNDRRMHGKGLVSNRSGQWRYRIGDYRIIADIQDNKLLILIIGAGHRRNIYD